VAQVNRRFDHSLRYCIGVAGIYVLGLAALWRWHFSVMVMMVLLGVSKLVFASAVLWINRHPYRMYKGDLFRPTDVRAWYGFGVNSFISQILIWLVLNLPLLFLGYEKRLDQAAVMNVLYTFLLPCQYIFLAVFNFYTPAFVKLGKEQDRRRGVKLLYACSLSVGALAGAYSLFLFLAGSKVAVLVFGKKFAGVEFGLFTMVPLLLSQISSTRTFLKATGRVKDTVIGALAGATVMVTWIALKRPTSYEAAALAVVVAYLTIVGVLMLRVHSKPLVAPVPSP
jgi:O-antigen/teichoic acid export membrane protein